MRLYAAFAMFGHLYIISGWLTVCYFHLACSCTVSHQPDGVHLNCSYSHVTLLSDFSEYSGVVEADVSHNNLSVLPDFLTRSMPHLQYLDLSHNVIREFNERNLGEMRHLENLDASHNRLHSISSTAFTGLSVSLNTVGLHYNRLSVVDGSPFLELSNLTFLRLDSNNLTSLSPRMFRGLVGLRYLNLNYNRLGSLHNETFMYLVNLRSLLVEGNQLEHLDLNAFVGLTVLTEINMMHNRLQYWSMPKGIFAPLKSVTRISVCHNDILEKGGYPEGVFGDLVNVSYVALDTYDNLTFGFGFDFTRWSFIHTLDLHHNCKIRRLSNSSFQGFRNSSLHTLDLSSCGSLVYIETCAFCELPNLKTLDLRSSNRLKFPTALLALYGLQGQSMESISLRSVGTIFAFATAIDYRQAKYLKNICVRQFDISKTNLQSWKSDAMWSPSESNFTRCLERADFSKNSFLGDTITLYKILIFCKNLTSFSIQEQKVYYLTQASCLFSSELDCGNRASQQTNVPDTFFLPIPRNLVYLNMSAMSTYFNAPPHVLRLYTGSALKVLDISYGVLAHCKTTFVGADNLEILEMSGNYCDRINDDIFDHLPSLRRLSLASTHLNASDIRFRTHRLLRNLTKLELLDLSNNLLVEVQGHSLPAQPRLRQLKLSSNSFTALPVDLGLHPELTELDLSFNKITSLTPSERDALDDLAARHHFRLYLRGNPLLCTCLNLDFLHWLWDTSVVLDGDGPDSRRYMCSLDTGEITDTEKVNGDWKLLWRRCIGKQVFTLAMATFLLQLMTLMVAYHVSRNWTHIMYAWNVLRRIHVPRREDFRKDAYLVYAEADTEYVFLELRHRLERHGLRLLLRHTEDTVSSVLAENIVKNIEDSWKVLLLVTRAFAMCDWSCGYTVQQAQRSISDNLPNRVIVVFLEDPRRLPPMASLEVLLRNYPEKNVFHVHRDLPDDHPTWTHLAQAILGDNNQSR